ncbi:Unknown protein sequence [Pseudomonas syringae pv. syringae]|nr:Unknown protein sequence [Pseudomonas syringae pv. syringae]
MAHSHSSRTSTLHLYGNSSRCIFPQASGPSPLEWNDTDLRWLA